MYLTLKAACFFFHHRPYGLSKNMKSSRSMHSLPKYHLYTLIYILFLVPFSCISKPLHITGHLNICSHFFNIMSQISLFNNFLIFIIMYVYRFIHLRKILKISQDIYTANSFNQIFTDNLSSGLFDVKKQKQTTTTVKLPPQKHKTQMHKQLFTYYLHHHALTQFCIAVFSPN